MRYNGPPPSDEVTARRTAAIRGPVEDSTALIPVGCGSVALKTNWVLSQRSGERRLQSRASLSDDAGATLRGRSTSNSMPMRPTPRRRLYHSPRSSRPPTYSSLRLQLPRVPRICHTDAQHLLPRTTSTRALQRTWIRANVAVTEIAGPPSLRCQRFVVPCTLGTGVLLDHETAPPRHGAGTVLKWKVNGRAYAGTPCFTASTRKRYIRAQSWRLDFADSSSSWSNLCTERRALLFAADVPDVAAAVSRFEYAGWSRHPGRICANARLLRLLDCALGLSFVPSGGSSPDPLWPRSPSLPRLRGVTQIMSCGSIRHVE